MKKAIVIFILMIGWIALGLPSGQMAQAQVWEEWVATYNGPGNTWDEASCMALSGENLIFVSGMSEADLVTIMYNANGVEQWVDRYDGPHHEYDEAHAIIVDEMLDSPDDYMYIYATGYSYGVMKDFVTIKYNGGGQRLWVQRFDGPDHWNDEAYALAADNYGNILVTGYSAFDVAHSSFATIKYSQGGTQLWVATYQGLGGGWDVATCIAIDPLNNIYVAGASDWGDGEQDLTLVKYSSAGALLWAARYDEPSEYGEWPTAMTLDSDGNILLTGYAYLPETEENYLTVKFNPDGQLLWAAAYNGPLNNLDIASDVVLDADDNVYVTGRAWSDSSMCYATIKYNTEGQQLWIAEYAGITPGSQTAADMAIDNQANIYVTGTSPNNQGNNDFATVQYNSDGIEQWVIRYSSAGVSDDRATALALAPDQSVYVTGYSYSGPTLDDYITIKYSQTGPPTPVVLSSFTAAAASDGVALRWQTASEVNCYGWRVERKQGENQYQDISPLILGQGTTSEPQNYTFLDENAEAGQHCTYRLEQIDLSGSVTFSAPITITLTAAPIEFRLLGAFPNPFNAFAAISYQLSSDSFVSLRVSDISGRQVATLVDGWRDAGTHEVTFDGSDLPSGIYLYQLKADGFTASRKMVLLK